jgi:hypothetical protein
MKTSTIIQAAVLLAVIALATSCSPSREYYSSYPRHSYSSFSLVIDPVPDIYVSRYADRRCYWYNSNGYRYWRGYDNRYYLDRDYMNKVHYNRREYNEWKRYDDRDRDDRRRFRR